MTDYDNTNRGVLFKNDDKKTEKHPDYNGSININGTEHWLSAWIQTSKKGTKFMSLSIGAAKEQKQKDEGALPQVDGGQTPFDDDIPF